MQICNAAYVVENAIKYRSTAYKMTDIVMSITHSFQSISLKWRQEPTKYVELVYIVPVYSSI